MSSVLFVCTANMCRSPMAEVLFRDHVHRRAQGDWTVRSAGVAAFPGSPATDLSVQVVGERGLDLTGHRSQSVNRQLLQSSDLVLVMEAAHRRDLAERFPGAAAKIYLLTEMAGEHGDVDDPVGTSIDNYRRTADRLTDLFTRGFDRIRALADGA